MRSGTWPDSGIKQGDYAMHPIGTEKLLARRFGHSGQRAVKYNDKRKPRVSGPWLSKASNTTTKKCHTNTKRRDLFMPANSLPCPRISAQLTILTSNPATVEAFAAKHTGAEK